MPNIGPALKALSMRAMASPPVISFACAISNSPSVPWLLAIVHPAFPLSPLGGEEARP